MFRLSSYNSWIKGRLRQSHPFYWTGRIYNEGQNSISRKVKYCYYLFSWYNPNQCAPKERYKMSMTASNIRYYTDRERVAYQKISGMNEVLTANPADRETVSAKYPDAVFAIMIHDEMVCGIEGIRNIVQKAHTSIMDGENIENIRFRYTKEMDEYFREHTWDD